MLTIFCPQCDTLILEAAACPACGWQRPLAACDEGAQVWQGELGHRLSKPRCYPALAGDVYCLPTEDGLVVARDLHSGEPAWERSLGAGSLTHALASDGVRIFAGCVDVQPLPTPGKAFLALDAATGEPAWQYPTKAHSLSAAALAGDTLYFTSSDGLLHAVDARNGHECWMVAHPAWGPEAPAAGAGVVCAGGRGNRLIAYAAADGHQLWRFEAEGWFAHELRVADGCVYALCWDGALYALDLPTGRLLWKASGERDKGFTVPPVVADGRVFIASRVYRANGGQQEPVYAMLALQAEDGAEQWRFYTKRHILAPPALVADTLLFGGEDGAFYALDATSGTERWRMQLESRIVTRPLAVGDLVYIGARDGTLYAIRWRAQPAEHLLSPHVYQSRGEDEQAAVAYALRGEFAEAAGIYERKPGQEREAAQLYERAGQPENAAPLWERLGELRRARDLYQEAGDKTRLAEILERLGEPLPAARLYEEIGSLESAARLYEQFGDRSRAAELYRRIGQYDQARSIWESLGEWEKLVEHLIAEQKPAEAARILEQQGQLERAAELYEQVGQLAQALHMRVALEHWERVADLAFRLGEYEQEAAAHERLGQTLPAAEAYERAGQQLASAERIDEARVAGIYERAAQLYGEALDEERATDCRRQARRYRHLPEIVVVGGAQEVFVEYEWNTLKLRVENTGHGPARMIEIALRGAFDVQGNRIVPSLLPQKAEFLEVFVRPHKDEYGPKVPLEISVVYADVKGEQYSGTQRIPIHVLQKSATPVTITPLEIRVEDDQFQQSGRGVAAVSPGVGEKASAAAPSQEIEQQRELLKMYRRTLAHLIRQTAQYGGEVAAPPHVVNNIYEARENIRRIKDILSHWGVPVAEHPDDEPS